MSAKKLWSVALFLGGKHGKAQHSSGWEVAETAMEAMELNIDRASKQLGPEWKGASGCATQIPDEAIAALSVPDAARNVKEGA